MAHYEQGTKCTSKRASNGQAGKGEAQKTGATKRCLLPDTFTFLQLSGKKLCYVEEKVASQPGLYDDRLQDALFLLLPLQGYLQPWGNKEQVLLQPLAQKFKSETPPTPFPARPQVLSVLLVEQEV
ncbi:TRAF family member-associated NF-kappa-B activator [Platysternon megacephalum]|uniref:TRAF family member-associated NF-kappa-B activator n=1 Tax=Platysternon megacephalum TaxID=55544 RepID=A0A4D9F265_9SAUR|nr:TRAF family member-associated NF-kappa-B activator [Platysternon megacephalum]